MRFHIKCHKLFATHKKKKYHFNKRRGQSTVIKQRRHSFRMESNFVIRFEIERSIKLMHESNQFTGFVNSAQPYAWRLGWLKENTCYSACVLLHDRELAFPFPSSRPLVCLSGLFLLVRVSHGLFPCCLWIKGWQNRRI